MNLISTRVITTDVARLIGFYEGLTGLSATRYTPEFAEIGTGAARLAIAGAGTVPPFVAPDEKILEFLVADVDAVEQRDGMLMPPTTMPWGNRSMLLRDPDGTLINVFTPVTEAARARFR
ncbi:putative enzyme related to lactoylglutathione lyase [Actinoplanes octamycinicus]|uniref:Putative enzyme related to lactoylglutathione lyase n=1 Tax=Actinoplanes octamycinicus TaxID=135948 RepID=A0A7W7H4L3_9ACTN|nr:VOC family protein [Actinoplanes octamycinicus]MBB4743714.1 putative enzyme related to lactoylglutathione lyase [Actinoplanes octamycinicus]GIE61142.1 glyoxalase [Actinoplanes octamycinicus]